MQFLNEKKDTKNENNLKVIFVPIVPNFYCLLTKYFEKKEKISPLWATLAPQFLFLLLCFKIADVSVDTRQRSKSFLLPSVTFNPLKDLSVHRFLLPLAAKNGVGRVYFSTKNRSDHWFTLNVIWIPLVLTVYHNIMLSRCEEGHLRKIVDYKNCKSFIFLGSDSIHPRDTKIIYQLNFFAFDIKFMFLLQYIR